MALFFRKYPTRNNYSTLYTDVGNKSSIRNVLADYLDCKYCAEGNLAALIFIMDL